MHINALKDWYKEGYKGQRPIPNKSRLSVSQMLAVQQYILRLQEDCNGQHGCHAIDSDFFNGTTIHVIEHEWAILAASGTSITLGYLGSIGTATTAEEMTAIVPDSSPELHEYSFAFGVMPNDRLVFNYPSSLTNHCSPTVVKITDYSASSITCQLDADVSNYNASQVSNPTQENLTAMGKVWVCRVRYQWGVQDLQHSRNVNRCAHCRRDFSNSLKATETGVKVETVNGETRTWYCNRRKAMEADGTETVNDVYRIKYKAVSPSKLSSFNGEQGCDHDCDGWQAVTKDIITKTDYTKGDAWTSTDTHYGQWLDDIITSTSYIGEWRQRVSFGEQASGKQYTLYHQKFPGIMSAYGGLETATTTSTSGTEGTASTITHKYRPDERYLGYPDYITTYEMIQVNNATNNAGEPTYTITPVTKLAFRNWADVQTLSGDVRPWTIPHTFEGEGDEEDVTKSFTVSAGVRQQGLNNGNVGRKFSRVTKLETNNGLSYNKLEYYRGKDANGVAIASRDIKQLQDSNTKVVLKHQSRVWYINAGSYLQQTITITGGGGAGTPLPDPYQLYNMYDGTYMIGADGLSMHQGDRRGGVAPGDTAVIAGKAYIVTGVYPCAVDLGWDDDDPDGEIPVLDSVGYLSIRKKYDAVTLDSPVTTSVTDGDSIQFYAQKEPTEGEYKHQWGTR